MPEKKGDNPSRLALYQRFKRWVGKLKNEVVALYYAAKDPRTPYLAKILAVIIVAYAVSPIDLIPDFIPILGYLDDLLILPLGIFIVIKLIPPQIMDLSRQKAREYSPPIKSRTWPVGLGIALLWLMILLVFYVVFRLISAK